MGASAEPDFVSDIKSETDRTQEAFHTAAWVQHTAHIVRPHVRYGASKVRECRWHVAKKHIQRATLDGCKQFHRAASFELRAKQAGDRAHIGTLESDGSARVVRKPLGEGPVKIIIHFRFELDVPAQAKRGAAAHSQRVFVARPKIQPRVVGERAYLSMVLCKSRRC